jgi:hypothetical protein
MLLSTLCGALSWVVSTVDTEWWSSVPLPVRVAVGGSFLLNGRLHLLLGRFSAGFQAGRLSRSRSLQTTT